VVGVGQHFLESVLATIVERNYGFLRDDRCDEKPGSGE
jgi:hypothetical protein